MRVAAMQSIVCTSVTIMSVSVTVGAACTSYMRHLLPACKPWALHVWLCCHLIGSSPTGVPNTPTMTCTTVICKLCIWQRLLLQVNPKRHNVPGMKERGRGRGRGPPRGRGFFPRGRGRGAFYGGFDPSFGYGGYGGGYGYDLMSTGMHA